MNSKIYQRCDDGRHDVEQMKLFAEILFEYGLESLLDIMQPKISNCEEQSNDIKKLILDTTKEWKKNNPYQEREIIA